MSLSPRSLDFLAALLHAQDVDAFMRFGNASHLFREHELPWWAFVQEHVLAHGALPHPTTFEDQTGRELPALPVEPASYYHQHLLDRYVADGVRDGFQAAKELIKDDPHAAHAMLLDKLLALETMRQGRQVHDYRESATELLTEYALQVNSGGISGMRSNWAMSRGYRLAVVT